jgi:hypothetical protein
MRGVARVHIRAAAQQEPRRLQRATIDGSVQRRREHGTRRRVDHVGAAGVEHAKVDDYLLDVLTKSR